MQGITVIRGSCLILLGITAYSILLWAFTWKIPGSLRKDHKPVESKCNRRRVRILVGYYLLLGIMVLIEFLLIKYMVRGGL